MLYPQYGGKTPPKATDRSAHQMVIPSENKPRNSFEEIQKFNHPIENYSKKFYQI